MRFQQIFFIIALMALLISPNYLAGEEKNPLSRFDAQQLKKLKAGEPVCTVKLNSEEANATAGEGYCTIIINAPIDKCFEIIVKIDEQVYYVPNKTKSDIVSREGNRLLIDNVYRYYGTTTAYHSIYTIFDKNYRMEYEIDQSRPHDLAENSGFYQFVKIDRQNTLLTYGSTRLDVGFNVPEFVKKIMLGKSLPAMAINIKKYIESNGEWRQGK